jgi:hypothetical protein
MILNLKNNDLQFHTDGYYFLQLFPGAPCTLNILNNIFSGVIVDCIDMYGTFDGKILNNIFAVHTLTCLRIYGGSISNLSIDFNDSFNFTEGDFVSDDESIDINDFIGLHNLRDIDPMFVNPTSDFHLQEESPCRDSGIGNSYEPTVPLNDFDNVTRRVDVTSMGFYEYIIIPPPIPPVPALQNDLLIEQFRVDRPNITGFIQKFMTQLAIISAEVAKFALINSIDLSSGAELDKWGAIVDLSRDTLNDTIYRNEIKFKIFLNTSKGTPETLIIATRYLTGATSIQYDESTPAHVTITINALIGTFASVYDKLKRIKPAGVSLTLQVNTSEHPFAFGGEGGLPPFFMDSLGFEETGGGPSVGGELTELIT